MKKLLLFAGIIAVSLPIFAQTEITIEINELSQDCDTVRCTFLITDSSNSDEGMVLMEIKNTTDSVIVGNIMFYHPPLVSHSYTMYAQLFNQTAGSHICELTAYNTNGGAGINNIKDIDLTICHVGIENAESQWCYVTILSKNMLVSISNHSATLVTMFDIHGKEIMRTKIFGTTLLPIDFPIGVYSLLIQQSASTKIFKLAVTDW